MPYGLTQVAVILAVLAVLALVWYLISLIKRINTTLNQVDRIITTSNEAISKVLQDITPVIERMEALETSAHKAIEDVRAKLDILDNEIVPLVRDIRQTANSYQQLEKVIENKINSELPVVVEDVKHISGNVKQITNEVQVRIHQTRELFDAVRETGQTLRMFSGIIRSGLTGLAVQVASIATGMKTSLEYLSENLMTKGGGKDEQ